MILLIINRNTTHDFGMATVQYANKLANGLAILQRHAVFAGDCKGFNDTGTCVFQLTL